MNASIRIACAALLAAFSSVASAAYTLLPGSSPQTTKAGTPFPNRIQLRVTDDTTGQPIGGKSINFLFSTELLAGSGSTCIVFSVPPPGGSNFLGCSAVTDANGIASVSMLGRIVGKGLFTWQVPGLPTAELTVTPSMTPASVAILSGASEMRVSNVPFDAVQVRVTRDGAPVTGLALSFTIDAPTLTARFMSGAGAVGVTTDVAGYATAPPFTVIGGVGTGTIHVKGLDASGVQLDETLKFYAIGSDRAPYAPLWWGGNSQAGWGLALPQHGNAIFPVLFTYDAQGNPTWFVLGGAWTQGLGSTYDARLQSFKGAPYYAFDSSRVVPQVGASAPLQFSGDTSFTFKAPILQDPSVQPLRAIAMQPFDITGGRSTAEPSSYPFDLDLNDMWWGGASQSGWGIAIARKGTALFATWFTYDANGNPTWFVMPADSHQLDPTTWTGPIYRTSGRSILGLAPYDPSAYVATKVGDFTLRFDGMTRGTFDYTVDGHTGSMVIQRFDF